MEKPHLISAPSALYCQHDESGLKSQVRNTFGVTFVRPVARLGHVGLFIQSLPASWNSANRNTEVAKPGSKTGASELTRRRGKQR